MLLDSWEQSKRVVIGTLHVPALPGTPRFIGGWQEVQDVVLADAIALADGGVDGLMLENFGDIPFFPRQVPAHTVAHLTQLAALIRRNTDLPLGINVLRNDGLSALAIAAATGSQFIRVNVLCGARVTDQGIIDGIAHDLLRERRLLGADVRILADVDVKHSAPIAAQPLADEVGDLIHRGLADGVIVSGEATGKATRPEDLREVKQVAGSTPVLIGSGVTASNVADYDEADGFIIGTAFKHDGQTGGRVDAARVRQLVDAVRAT